MLPEDYIAFRKIEFDDGNVNVVSWMRYEAEEGLYTLYICTCSDEAPIPI